MVTVLKQHKHLSHFQIFKLFLYLCVSLWTVVNYFILWTKIHCCCCCRFSRVRLYVTPGTVARQAPLSLRFSRQEYWSGLPGPPPGDLPNPGIKPASLTSTLAGTFFTTSTTWEAPYLLYQLVALWLFSKHLAWNRLWSQSKMMLLRRVKLSIWLHLIPSLMIQLLLLYQNLPH